MLRVLVLLFLTVPLLEIYLLLKVGSLIGALWTIFLVVLTAVLGTALLRWQGISTIRRLQACASRGEVPAIPMIEGAFLLFAGALLLTPGFFTDAVGFAILLPRFRHYLALQILKKGIWMSVNGQPPRGPGGGHSSGDHHTYNGDYKKLDD